ncbi:peptidase M76 family-domain-containing protein, partial [Pholiota molesta]
MTVGNTIGKMIDLTARQSLVMNNSGKDLSSAQVPQDTPAPTPQPSSAFERWRRKAMLVTGLGPVVVFMLKHLKSSGCEVPPANILCAPCDLTKSGGFSPDPGAVVLCAGNFFGEQHMESTITHELIHMYDHCRFKVDWSNLRHHACSEIRANNLSGDCRFTRELRRGIVAFSKQHQACVRRRAIDSVAANEACPDVATAERAVNEVWESCFTDTRPFDEFRQPSPIEY